MYEYRLYCSLAKTAARAFVPAPLCHGEAGEYRYMVMSIGGADLSTILSTHTVVEKLKIFYNAVSALKAIHDAGFLHRDLKPKNMLLMPGSREDVMIIDFGLAKKYRVNGRHIDNREKTTIAGTARYASVPCMMCTQASRRDDMYSLCYTMGTLFGRVLPWQNVNVGKKEDKMRKTLELKRSLEAHVVFRGCPPPLIKIYAMVMQLGFAEQPAYETYHALIDAHLHAPERV